MLGRYYTLLYVDYYNHQTEKMKINCNPQMNDISQNSRGSRQLTHIVSFNTRPHTKTECRIRQSLRQQQQQQQDGGRGRRHHPHNPLIHNPLIHSATLPGCKVNVISFMFALKNSLRRVKFILDLTLRSKSCTYLGSRPVNSHSTLAEFGANSTSVTLILAR